MRGAHKYEGVMCSYFELLQVKYGNDPDFLDELIEKAKKEEDEKSDLSGPFYGEE